MSLWAQPLAGMPLLQRQARLLKAAGLDPIIALASAAEEKSLMRNVAQGQLGVPEVRFELRANLLGAERFTVGNGFVGTDRFVLMRADWIMERNAIRQAMAAARATNDFVGFAHCGRNAGLAAATHDGLLQALDHLERAGQPVDDESRLAIIVAGDVAGVADSRQALAEAEDHLWQGCRKPSDGIVSRHINRYISLATSRRIAATAITPNQISIANLVLGLAAAGLAAMGGYWPVLAAAALFQVNSILDGVDGELARIRLQSSVLGEWLDTLSDDFSNLAFFAGLGLGAWRQSAATSWLWLTAATVLGTLAVALVYYVRLWRMGRGDILATDVFQPPRVNANRAPSVIDRVIALGTIVARKDLLVMAILVAAALGYAPFFLIIACMVAWSTLAALLFVLREPEVKV